jgi:hypothetical protein
MAGLQHSKHTTDQRFDLIARWHASQVDRVVVSLGHDRAWPPQVSAHGLYQTQIVAITVRLEPSAAELIYGLRERLRAVPLLEPLLGDLIHRLRDLAHPPSASMRPLCRLRHRRATGCKTSTTARPEPTS